MGKQKGEVCEIKILKYMEKQGDSENEQGIKRGSSKEPGGKVKEGSKRARERPQLAFLRFRCGTIAAYQSVSTQRRRGSEKVGVTRP